MSPTYKGSPDEKDSQPELYTQRG